MSQICKYYLRGSCKYGQRCHFLHEDPYNNYSYGRDRYSSSQNYYKNDNYSSQQNYYKNENYSSQQNYYKNENYPSQQNYYKNENYSRNHSQSYNNGYSDRNHEKHYSHTHSGYRSQDYYPRSSHTDNTYNPQQHYNRYHIDNRQSQREQRNSENIDLPEFLKIVNIELMQHEQSHMWPFTVVAPIKDFGNIPGFKDWSPEEVRCGYYEAMSKNTMFEFERNMREVQNGVVECRRIFKQKSNEAFNILKSMIQESRNPKKNHTETNRTTSAASTFSFDLSQLNANPSSISMDMNNPNYSFHSPASTNSLNFQGGTQAFFTNGTNPNSVMENSTPTFPITHSSNQMEPQSQMNTFSFNSNYIHSNQRDNIPSINNTSYSPSAELPTETMELFQAKIFKVGKVPLVPPPKELCF